VTAVPETPPLPDRTPVADVPEQEELFMHLEHDQLVAQTFRPVPPALLGRRAVIGLWALRIFAVLVSLMVIYTFIARLH
jgi:hypothetical protein